MKTIHKVLFTFSFIFFLVPPFSFSQELQFTEGEVMKVRKFRFSRHLHSSDGFHYLMFRRENISLTQPEIVKIKKLDSNFETISEYEYKSERKSLKVADVKCVDGHLLWLLKEKPKGSKAMDYYVSRTDLDGNEIETKKIISTRRTDKMHFKVDKSESRVLFYCWHDQQEQVSFNLIEYTPELKKVWSISENIKKENTIRFISLNFAEDKAIYVNVRQYDRKYK